MKRYVSRTLVVSGLSLMLSLVLTACAHKASMPDPLVKTDDAKSTIGVAENKDIGSFRLSDVATPQAAAEELEIIPTEVNPMVEKWIAYFQGNRGRPHMERYLSRSTRYEKLMKKVLRDNGLPEDLFYIALIESGFSARATSHASAVGYWQFIRGTGKRYGLAINAFVDERRDPVFATQAAAEYFKGLYSVFGSWYLAMASYNVGENRVKREVMNHYTRDFWELARKKRFPKETINYIPKFIAAKLIAKDPAKYGFEDIDYLPPIEFDHIEIKQPVNLRLMAEKLNYNYEDFKALNPMYKGEVAPLSGNVLTLRIPPGMNEAAVVAANEATVDKVQFVADTGDTSAYKIRSGDSLHTIARKYRTSVAYLRDLNDIPRGKKLRVGTKIYVPDRTPLKERPTGVAVATKKPTSPTGNAPVPAPAMVQDSSGHFYIVQSGDSLYTIAHKYSTSVSELQKINKIKRGKTLKIGIKLRVSPEQQENDSEPKGKEEAKNKPAIDSGSARQVASVKKVAVANNKVKVHVVKKGENLENIAQKYKVSMNELTQKNKIKDPAKLLVGAKLVIPGFISE